MILKDKIVTLKKEFGNYFVKTNEFKLKLKPLIIKETEQLNYRNPSLRERIYYIENELKEVGKCENCGKETSFHRNGYSKFCSQFCINTYIPDQCDDLSVENLKSFLMTHKKSKGWLRSKKLKSKINSIFLFTKDFDKYDSSLNERVYSLINNINDRPNCKMCENKCNYKYTGIYTVCCSKECSDKDEDKEIKKVKTCLYKYGVTHYTKTKAHKESKKKTCLDRYGVECGLSNLDVREKIKKTNIVRYGHENFNETKTFKEKYTKTCLNKYNVEHFSKSKEFKDKIENSCITKYGVRHTMQVESIFQKSLNNKFKKKMYTFKSGKTAYVQGYEPKVLEELENHFNECDIIVNQKDIPSFWYEYEGKLKRYYPDIYLKCKNLIIEVKSKYTYDVDIEKNLLKRQCCLKAGYNFLFVVF